MIALGDTELRAGHLIEANLALQEGEKVAKAGADLVIRDLAFVRGFADSQKRR